TPPKVIKSTPGNFETNYTGNSLTLQFDEFVVLKDASSEIVVSPMIGNSPKIKIKGKTVEIKFDSIPQPNTTYTINLGKSIADYNEGNLLDSTLFVFSTGSVIDTLTIKGKITDAEWGKAEKDMFVMLFSDTSDSVPLKKQPDYIAKINENGEFQIKHIKNGTYRVFALSDMNANYLFDLPDEKIAFTDQFVKFDSSLVFVNLSAFKEATDRQFISSAEFTQYGKILMIFNLPVENINVTPLNYQFKKAWFLMEQNIKKDTLSFWLTDLADLDSLILEVSINGMVLDTLELEVPKKPTESGIVKGGRGSGKISSFELKATINGSTSSPLNYNDSLILTWSHPIVTSNQNNYILTQGKDTIPFNMETIDAALRNQALLFNRKEDSTYNLLILPNAV
ncbi:MAG: Ig-like domain-containing domain, partial [Bacteroidia bacterium]